MANPDLIARVDKESVGKPREKLSTLDSSARGVSGTCKGAPTSACDF